MVHTIASPDEYLTITGGGIKTPKIVKEAWVWLFQRCQRFSIQPHDYSMNLQAMTQEKLQFILPVVFTISPNINQSRAAASQAPRDTGNVKHNPEDRGDALMKYAMLLADAERDSKDTSKGQRIENIVKGIIEGESRVLVSSMAMEEIFTEREEFKRRIFRNIQGELDQFGLKIYNTNIKELRHAPQSSYFEYLSRKAHEGAINQARINVAEAQRKGNIGGAARQGEQNREIAKINAETAVQKTKRDSEKAKAEATLAIRKAAFNRDVNIAQIEATRATETRDEELRKEVEVKHAQTKLERLRASDIVRATIAKKLIQNVHGSVAEEMTIEKVLTNNRALMLKDGRAITDLQYRKFCVRNELGLEWLETELKGGEETPSSQLPKAATLIEYLSRTKSAGLTPPG